MIAGEAHQIIHGGTRWHARINKILEEGGGGLFNPAPSPLFLLIITNTVLSIDKNSHSYAIFNILTAKNHALYTPAIISFRWPNS